MPDRLELIPLDRPHLARTREWANDSELMRLMDRKQPVSPVEHEAWFASLPRRADCAYFAIETVDGRAHIGNARPAVVFDVLARLLRRRYPLTFARNFTDVDDRINAAAAATGRPIGDITAKYRSAYNEDMAALGVLPPDVEPAATDHIGDMVAFLVSDLSANTTGTIITIDGGASARAG